MTRECVIDRNLLMPVYKIGCSMSKKVICYFCKRRVTHYIMWKEFFVNIIMVRKIPAAIMRRNFGQNTIFLTNQGLFFNGLLGTGYLWIFTIW